MDIELFCASLASTTCTLTHCALFTTDTTKELQRELNEFTNVLIHSESYMRKTIAENVQVCGNSHPHYQTMPIFFFWLYNTVCHTHSCILVCDQKYLAYSAI